MKAIKLSPTKINSFSGALFDRKREHRHLLWRRWSTGPRACFICLNPSIADAETNDHTVTKMIGFARQWKFGAIDVVNIFDYISTDPELLYVKDIRELSSVYNDPHIVAAAKRAGKVFCAWGNHGEFLRRARNVVKLLDQHQIVLWCLKKNANGSPAHPLRLPYDLRPVRYYPGDVHA